MFEGAFSTSTSASSTAASQSANNQDFEGMFEDRNLGSTDYTGPGLVVAAFFGLYLFLETKGLV